MPKPPQPQPWPPQPWPPQWPWPQADAEVGESATAPRAAVAARTKAILRNMRSLLAVLDVFFHHPVIWSLIPAIWFMRFGEANSVINHSASAGRCRGIGLVQ